jgi:hypothetical protein
MFAAQHDNPASLRQGDIIADVFFPLTRPALLKYLATYNSGSDIDIRVEPFVEAPQGAKKRYVQAISHGVVAHGTVISQCCDLDKKHPKNSFSLCRLIPYERARFRHGTDALENNIDPWGPENPYFQFFYLGQVDGLVGEYLADFTLLTSFAWADYDLILGSKKHQLDDLNRNKFRVKVGALFGRPTEEDIADGLTNPYQPVAPRSRNLIDRVRGFFGRR